MIVKNIEKYCAKHNISISKLERALGFGNSTIAKWEKSSPTIEKLSAVARYFGITVDNLIAEETEG